MDENLVLMYCLHHLVNTMLGHKCLIQGVGDEILFQVSHKNDDQLNENLNQETIFIATTLIPSGGCTCSNTILVSCFGNQNTFQQGEHGWPECNSTTCAVPFCRNNSCLRPYLCFLICCIVSLSSGFALSIPIKTQKQFIFFLKGTVTNPVILHVFGS